MSGLNNERFAVSWKMGFGCLLKRADGSRSIYINLVRHAGMSSASGDDGRTPWGAWSE